MGAGADIRNVVVIVTIGLSLAACAGSSGPREAGAFGKSRGHYKVGAPYQVNGVWYSPRVDYNYDETGTASWYGEAFNGRPTANGEIFDLNQVSAAHKTLQLPSVVEVTNLQNSRALKVRVNDRGPFAGDRVIDLSRRAAQLLGFERAGTAPVRVRIIKDESIKVAEAAMRGDIGSARLASEPRPVQTQLAATGPRPSAIRAAPPTGIAQVRGRSAGFDADRAGSGRFGRFASAGPEPAGPECRTTAGRERAIRATGGKRPDAPAGLAFADRLGAGRHPGRRAPDPPTDVDRCAARPDLHSSWDVCGRGERQSLAGTLRRLDRHRGGAGQCERQRAVSGQAGTGGKRDRGAAAARETRRERDTERPSRQRLRRRGPPGRIGTTGVRLSEGLEAK